jgi:hypothetical protein
MSTIYRYHPEDGGDMFHERSGLNTATQCNTTEDICHCYRRESTAEDCVLRPYIDNGSLKSKAKWNINIEIVFVTGSPIKQKVNTVYNCNI